MLSATRLRARMALLAAAPLLVLAGCGEDAAAPAPAAGEPERRFAVQGDARAKPAGRWTTARVVRAVRLRAAPGGRRLERLRPRTEFGSPKVLHVLRRRGRWLQVLAPERPNRRPGWIPASATRPGAVDVSLHADLSRRILSVRRDGRVLRRIRVAVGGPGTETPAGRFAVTDKLRTRDRGSPYGCCAVALTGHQPKLVRGWPGGDRLAVHATPQVETIGQAASLGCLRAGTRDMQALLRLVPLGAPVFVSA